MSDVNPQRAEFEAMLDETLNSKPLREGTVINGTITALEKDTVIIDAGLKVEGRVPLREFGTQAHDGSLAVGDVVEVYLERIENALGEAVLSRAKARREESWGKLQKFYQDKEKVDGIIFGQVKGGLTVDLEGAMAFLPRSQVDMRPIRDVTPLLNTTQPFLILKMDKKRGNIVVSRRMVLEESRAEQQTEFVQKLEEGQITEGTVKNITDYGAFVDLGGIDGLLHVTDIAWKRINHPAEVLTVGQVVKVKVIRVNQNSHRISLGIKQLQEDPWLSIEEKYPVDTKLKGQVTNITDYGAFVEMESGLEGLIHVSEMSWTKKNMHPGKILSTSQEVEVIILEIDMEKRRISLGLKQCVPNPWEEFNKKYPKDTIIEGIVKNKTEFGLFVGFENDIDGMVHLSDLDWKRSPDEAIEDFKKGETIKTIVLDVDVEKERIALGIKQLTKDPMEGLETSGKTKKGEVVTAEVIKVTEHGLEVKIIDTEVEAFIKRSELSRDKDEQRPERFSLGQKVDARISRLDKKSRKVNLSIKALEIAEEKEAVEQYGSSDSGASLGDILGVALDAKESGESRSDADKKADKKAEKKSSAKTSVSKPKAKKESQSDSGEKKSVKAKSTTKKPEAKKSTAKKPTAKKPEAKEAADKKDKTE